MTTPTTISRPTTSAGSARERSAGERREHACDEPVDHLVEVVLCDAERRPEQHRVADVAVHRRGALVDGQAAVEGGAGDLLRHCLGSRERLLRAPVGDELDSVEQADSTHLADVRVAFECIAEPFTATFTHRPRAVDQSLTLDHGEHGVGDGGTDRMMRPRKPVRERVGLVDRVVHLA